MTNVVSAGEAETGDAGHSLCSDWRLVIQSEDSVGVVSLDSEVMPGAEADREAGDETELDTGDGEDDTDQGVVDGDGDVVRNTHDSSADPRVMIEQS